LHAQIPDELHELGCGDRADADLSAQIHWIPQTADGRAVQPPGRV
jgi:hypothetical protein